MREEDLQFDLLGQGPEPGSLVLDRMASEDAEVHGGQRGLLTTGLRDYRLGS